MPAERNTLLRVVVPLIVALVGIVVVVAGFNNSARQPRGTTPVPAGSPTPGTPGSATSGATGAAPSTHESTAPSQAPAPSTTSPPLDPAASGQASTAPATNSATPAAPDLAGLRAVGQPALGAALSPLGAATPGGPYRSMLEFTLEGAGVQRITMADFFETVQKVDHYQVQQQTVLNYADGRVESLTSLSVRGVVIDGQFVDLYGSAGAPVWREIGPGAFEARIVAQDDSPVLKITRIYNLEPGRFDFAVRQNVENLTSRPLAIEWVQYGPIELHEDISGYGLDTRRVRFGYLLDPSRDASRQFVEADKHLSGRASFIERATSNRQDDLWPRPDLYKNGTGELVWLAQTSRYFAFAVFPLVDDAAAQANAQDFSKHPIRKGLTLASDVHAVVRGPSADPKLAKLLIQMTSAPLRVEPGKPADLSFAAYAGPLGRKQLVTGSVPSFDALGLRDIVIYNLGGPCALCTLQPLAKGLLWFLTLLHDWVVFDWAIAIMILVVCVRAVLHPITRRSQVGMLRFAKQMQSLAPKQAKLREKFKDDPKRMQEEMVKLMREEKVSYAGALGCLPMFLQSPVWFALYAMLYFSFDLRHEAGFFGVFQALSGGRWDFLADLSVADHFIYFGRSVFSFSLFGHVTGINVLPVLMGVVFFVQQKYLTPPPSTALTPEQETQQKIIKYMTVFMFPLMMYNAPSGLVIYFITNSTLGILESRWIRAHAERVEKERAADGQSLESWRKRVQNTAPKKR